MNSVLLQDLYRYIGDSNKKLLLQLRYIFFTPGYQFLFCWAMHRELRMLFPEYFGKYLRAAACFMPGFRFR